MKKFIPVILALVFTFAMSSTAFADAGSDTPTLVGNDNIGETSVTVEVNSTNLSVTVPLNMTIVAPVAGGVCDVPNTYAIVNKSATPVRVKSIQVTDADGGLSFSNSVPTTAITDKDKVSLALTPTGGSSLQLTTSITDSGLGGFDMDAATTEGGVSKAITITAVSGMLSSTAKQDSAFTIKFTVEADSASA